MGEITRNDLFGKSIIDNVKKYNINTVLEIGSWDGTGSTACFCEGMSDLQGYKSLVCLEIEQSKFKDLQQNTSIYSWIECCNQSSISYTDLVCNDFDKIWDSPYNGIPKDDGYGEEAKKNLVRSWFDEDMIKLKQIESGYLISNKDKFYQGALIDGGEFNGYSEYMLLKDRVNFLFLDDYYNAYKTRQIALELQDDANWEIIAGNKRLRNGFAIFKRKNLL
jgi:hypothetical protein